MKSLIRTEAGAVHVLVSHSELNSLVAKLMHIAELDSDVEHRNAVKGELKLAARSWLDDLYSEAGYVNHEFDESKVIDIRKLV